MKLTFLKDSIVQRCFPEENHAQSTNMIPAPVDCLDGKLLSSIRPQTSLRYHLNMTHAYPKYPKWLWVKGIPATKKNAIKGKIEQNLWFYLRAGIFLTHSQISHADGSD